MKTRKRYYIPVHWTKTRSARYKAILDTIGSYQFYAVDATSAAEAARLLIATLRPEDAREVSVREPARWEAEKVRTMMECRWIANGVQREPVKEWRIYKPLTLDESWAQWVKNVEARGIISADMWVTFTRRTEDPKLAWIEAQLDRRGIRHRRNGESAHAPILEVQAYRLAYAWTILNAPATGPYAHYKTIDDIPDDAKMFRDFRAEKTTA